MSKIKSISHADTVNPVLEELKNQGKKVNEDIIFLKAEQVIIAGEIKALNKKFDKLSTQLDWFFGKYTKFDEEQTLISYRVADHTDRIEKLEQKVGITYDK